MISDEPVNGLDPEGIIWVRNLLRGYAAQGRAVLVSSHLMAEMALTADRLVIIGRGRLIADTSVEEFIRAASGEEVLVRSNDQSGLAASLTARGADLVTRVDGAMLVHGLPAAQIGAAAAARGTVIHELTPQQRSLEEAFMQLTAESVEFHASPQPGLANSGSKAS
jgi:ABC-2 type transport system ATP-binding protein